MNPISTFEPTIGAHVHDTLNNLWITLTATDVEEMERDLRCKIASISTTAGCDTQGDFGSATDR